MGLYTDSDVIGSSDLLNLDVEINDVAAAESITLTGDTGVVRQAWNEAADGLFEKMDSFGGSVNLLVGAGVQMATLLTNYGMGVSRSRIFLSQIVVDDGYAARTSPVRRWLTYAALTLFYRDASARFDKDRYERKRARFESDAKTAWRRLSAKGLPIVLQPLPCPGAIHERNSGTWSASNLSSVVTGGAAGGTFDVVVSWVDQSKYVSQSSKGNAESGPSAIANLTVAAGRSLSVSIASLIPPNGKPYQSGTFADGILAMLNATGWNIYAGPSGGTLRLQNASPIPIATQSYALPGDPLVTGAILGPGQYPDANYAFLNTLNRG